MSKVKNFHSDITNEVIALETAKNINSRDAFLLVTTSLLEDIGVIEDFKNSYLSKKIEEKNLRLDGYSISDSEKENSKNIDLILSLYKESESLEKISKNEVKNLFDSVLNSIPVIQKSGIAAVKNLEFKDLTSYFKSHQVNKINIHLITNKLCEENVKFQKIQNKSLDTSIYLQCWDIKKLSEIDELNGNSGIVEINFENEFPEHPIQCLDTSSSNEIKTYVAALPGVVLGKIFADYGNSLLDSNIRAFLQFQGKVNKGIKDTIENEPHLFSSFNNGISITANDISFEKKNNNIYLKKISGFQVVNGGQTSSSISYIYSNGGYEKLKKVFVPTKFNVVQDKKKERDLVERVTLYANTQNKMQDADFSSRHPFFIKLEELSRTTPYSTSSHWYFERLRGSYNSEKKKYSNDRNGLKRFQLNFPQSDKFTKEELAKVYMNYKGFPYIASLGRQKCTNTFMNQASLLHKENKLNKEFYKFMISLLIIYKTTDKALKTEITSFKANILNLLISYLFSYTKNRIDYTYIWTNQELSDVLLSTLINWSKRIEKELIRTSNGKMLSEWSKKVDSWNHIKKLSLGYPHGIPREIKIKDNSGNFKDVAQIEMSKKLLNQLKLYKKEDFQKALFWGKENKIYSEEENSALILFINGASQGWNISPSLSRMEMALLCLEQAIEENIIKSKHL